MFEWFRGSLSNAPCGRWIAFFARLDCISGRSKNICISTLGVIVFLCHWRAGSFFFCALLYLLDFLRPYLFATLSTSFVRGVKSKVHEPPARTKVVALAARQRWLQIYTIWTYRSCARAIFHYSTCFPAAAAPLSSHSNPRKPLEPIASWNCGGLNKSEYDNGR